MARVDVLMPAFNAASTVREAVESLCAQTLRDIRIIIVDDGSTDDTPAVLRDLAASDARIVVVTTANQGIVEARNEALRNADAEFIACLDSDDIAFPHRLETQLGYLAAHPECVAVGSAVEHVDEKGGALPGMTQSGDPGLADAGKAPALEPYIVQSTLMARRADVAALGGYRHVPNSEDSDLFWRLSERGALVNLPEKLCKYRVHSPSISSSIVNGRVMAVGSQLGALSALRRRSGRRDLSFTLDAHKALKDAVTMGAMCDVASAQLDPEETRHLKISAAAKLMELARYRPYELDASDCAFVRSALPEAKRLSVQNQKEVEWYVTVTAARLVRKRLLAEAVALTPVQNYPVTAARVLLSR